ncbi:helix-turn-helix transcriptional regulator [Anaerovibrio lipolyticus]|uniref:helix-turn-helix domain-containing protein n=1 Tax=Anaerovibrio lipolyticus TaxID=82374 RepID=UPI0023F182E5|nr:helix-turn-helix transcriptional regulator [Anaerovibrio lipolyticus]
METSENMKSFADRIKELRLEQKKMSVAAAAREMEVAPANLNNWERGIAKPPLEALVKMAEFYNVTVDYMVGFVQNEKSRKITAILNSFTDEQLDDVLTILNIIKKNGR